MTDLDMVRPNVDEDAALDLARRLWGVRARKIVRLNGYDDANFWIQDVEMEGNPHIPCVHPSGYVLKVTNSADSNSPGVVTEQNELLLNLGKCGVECPGPQPTINGMFHSMERLEKSGQLHAVRLLTFVAGEILMNVPWNPQFGLEAGRQAALVDQILQRCWTPALEKRSSSWSLWSAAESALPHIHVVEEDANRILVDEVLTCFQKEIVDGKDSLNLKESLIHGDLNEQNIIVRQKEGVWSISAVLDFGDTHRAPLLFEVAISAAYMALAANIVGIEAADAALRDVVQGYKDGGGWFSENEAAFLPVSSELWHPTPTMLAFPTLQ